MTRHRDLFAVLLAVAVVATGIAVWAGPNFVIALPAAVAAVVAAGLLFLGAGLDRIPSRPLRSAPVPATSMVGLRRAFTSGRLGRESLVETLDRLERAGPNPDLPALRPDEADRIWRMPPKEFREYLRERLDQLERQS